MILRRPELVEQGQEVQIRTLVEFEGQKRHLWYSVEPRYADYLTTERLDPFVVGMLVPAMTAGEDMYVEGPVSERLHWNLTNYYMRIMTSVLPALHSVQILPAELSHDCPTPLPAGVATGFSAGIDSFCVLADHFFGETPQGYKVSHLVFNNVGSHGRAGRKLFMDRYERLLPCVREIGLPFVRIDSNLDDFYRISFGQTHTPRNASAVLILQKLFGRYLYASGLQYEDCFVGPAVGTGYTDPFTLHLLSTQATECISVGCQYSRVEKTAKVAGLELSHRYLDVCFDRTHRHGAGNCSVCNKCARTLLTLEILGKAHLYEKVFSLDKYRAARRRFMTKVLSSDHALLNEITRLARTEGYSFPLGIRILGISRRMGKRAERCCRSIIRRGSRTVAQ